MQTVSFDLLPANTELTDLFELLSDVQEDNMKLLLRSTVAKPGLKISSDDDFAYTITEDSISVNLGSCVFEDYTAFIPSGNQIVEIGLDWTDIIPNRTYLLAIVKEDLEWSHPYPTIAAGNVDVYGKAAASISIIEPAGQLDIKYIPIAQLNPITRQIIDKRYNNQLKMLKPVSPLKSSYFTPDNYAIDNLTLSIVHDIDSMASDKPRPASMHKGRRLIAKFDYKKSFDSDSFIGFAIKLSVASDCPQEYAIFFPQGEKIQNSTYISSLIPHEAGVSITVSVIALFKTEDNSAFHTIATQLITIGETANAPTVTITPLFDNSGILRFSITAADLSQDVDYFLYLQPTNTKTGIVERYDFQTVIQGNEYDYVMPTGYRFLAYKVTPVPYSRTATGNSAHGWYDIYDNASDFTYAMAFYIADADEAAAATLVDVELYDSIMVTGVHMSGVGSVVDGGVLNVGSSTSQPYQVPYSDAGDAKNIDGDLQLTDSLKITYTSTTTSDLSGCVITILYRYAR